MQKELSVVLREVKDPRVAEAFVSVSAAEVTPDLKYAKIFYSHLRGEKKEIEQGLKSSAGFMRKKLAQNLNLRITPELTFVEDMSIKNGAHISSILNKIEFSDDFDEESADEEKDD